ncbi:hypothetical protein C7271_00765 [filamentous cyanobacterium CCP5]|nr:hypothetical protein C7271_00765 [filamentous cyanobacterium CCP5]
MLHCLVAIALGGTAILAGCQLEPVTPARQVAIQQTWELAAGHRVAGHLVVASLGDVTIELSGHPVRAPFSGRVELAAQPVGCVYFSATEIPAYLFRFCGLQHLRLGPITAGGVIGTGPRVHFTTLRRQPDGTWAIVEPSSQILERALSPQNFH